MPFEVHHTALSKNISLLFYILCFHTRVALFFLPLFLYCNSLMSQFYIFNPVWKEHAKGKTVTKEKRTALPLSVRIVPPPSATQRSVRTAAHSQRGRELITPLQQDAVHRSDHTHSPGLTKPLSRYSSFSNLGLKAAPVVLCTALSIGLSTCSIWSPRKSKQYRAPYCSRSENRKWQHGVTN